MNVGRVDYIRLVVGVGHTENPRARLQNFVDLCQQVKGYMPAGMGDFTTKGWYDAKYNKMYFQVDVWGALADSVAKDAGYTYLRYATRLDWRVEVEQPSYEERVIALSMEQRSSTKARFMKINSADKKNEKGRAYGGVSYYSGSDQSERRLVYYRRAQGPWVVECRFLGTQSKRALDRATMAYMHTPDGVCFYDVLTEALCEQSVKLIEERTGLDAEALWGNREVASQEMFEERQESLLVQLESLWEQLDQTARDAFMQSLEGPASFEGAGYVPSDE